MDAKDGEDKSVAPTRGAKQKSRNVTLGKWWPATDDLDALLDLKPENKVKEYPDEHFAIRVAYQCPIEIDFKGKKVEAIANTLEDALAMQNLAFFSSGNGKGLFSKFKAAIDASTTIADLGEKLFVELKTGGKAEFALDLLEIENPADLQPPEYIREGLKWLVSQLRQQQHDLGVATPELGDKPKVAKAS